MKGRIFMRYLIFSLLFMANAMAQMYCPELERIIEKKNIILSSKTFKIYQTIDDTTLHSISDKLDAVQGYSGTVAAGSTIRSIYDEYYSRSNKLKDFDLKVKEQGERYRSLLADNRKDIKQAKFYKRLFYEKNGTNLTDRQKALIKEAEGEVKSSLKLLQERRNEYKKILIARSEYKNYTLRNIIKNSKKPTADALAYATKYGKSMADKNRWTLGFATVFAVVYITKSLIDIDLDERHELLLLENNPLVALLARKHEDKILVCDLINTDKEFKKKMTTLENSLNDIIVNINTDQEDQCVQEMFETNNLMDPTNFKAELIDNEKKKFFELYIRKNRDYKEE